MTNVASRNPGHDRDDGSRLGFCSTDYVCNFVQNFVELLRKNTQHHRGCASHRLTIGRCNDEVPLFRSRSAPAALRRVSVMLSAGSFSAFTRPRARHTPMLPAPRIASRFCMSNLPSQHKATDVDKKRQSGRSKVPRAPCRNTYKSLAPTIYKGAPPYEWRKCLSFLSALSGLSCLCFFSFDPGDDVVGRYPPAGGW